MKAPLKIIDLKEYIKAFKKWAKYEISKGEEPYSLSSLKAILLE